MGLPQGADVAREIPSVIARAGGSLDLTELEQTIKARFWPAIETVRGEDGLAYLNQCFQDGVTIAMTKKFITSSGTKIFLGDAGWEMANVTRSQAPAAEVSAEGAVIIDMSDAQPEIEYRFNNGTVIRGYLRPEAFKEFHGKPMTLRPRRLVDALYSAEIDGERVGMGFGTALKVNKSGMYFPDLLQQKARVKLIGFQRRSEAAGSSELASRRRGRRPGATWATVVCEVIYEHGGPADWPTISSAIERRPESELDTAWREEVMQVLRKYVAPNDRVYFQIVEGDGRALYALTERGRRLALMRAKDDRAPTLSKYLVKAINDDDAGNGLTNYELYALLFLATRLGRARDARTIYHRLPENFPDEESYAMMRLWIDQAEREQAEDD